MRKEVLDYICCPRCLPREVRLSLTVFKEGLEVDYGYLECNSCKRRYPILDSVPYFIKAQPFSYVGEEVRDRYLCVHFSDLLGLKIPNPFLRYTELLSHTYPFLDLGSGPGRLALELAKGGGPVLAVDLSGVFLKALCRLVSEGRLKVRRRIEGDIYENHTIELDSSYGGLRLFPLVADAQFLPFPLGVFKELCAINLLDRVRSPYKVLMEIDRVMAKKEANLLIADPFSWDEGFTPKRNWLGGRLRGRFKGRGLDNLKALMGGEKGVFSPPVSIEKEGYIEWILPHHINRSELIRSHWVLAKR